MSGEVMVEGRKTAAGYGLSSAAEEEEMEAAGEGEVVLDPSSGEAAEGGAPDRSRQIHPLEHQWTFWYDQPPSSRSRQVAWGSTIRHVHTFATVEDFWGLYNNIKHPSKLASGVDFHCFKKGIEPKWEDPICENGGKWTISGPRVKVDTWWLHTLLAMIGEHFDHGDEICGAVVNIRARQDKISIWTKNGSDEAAQMSIGRQWKEVLDYNETIGYILHDHAKHDRSPKSEYQV